MTRMLSTGTIVLGLTITSLLSGCGEPEAARADTKKSLASGMSEHEIRAAFDAHRELMFDDVKAEDDGQFEADKRRVRDIHALAVLVERFHDKTGRYPLADGPMSRLINVTIRPPGQSSATNSSAEMDVATLRAALRDVLGDAIEIPSDPMSDPQGYAAYNYSVWGKTYAVATYLYHHAKFSDQLAPQLNQYRVGSFEDLEMPVIEYAKILQGAYLKATGDGRRLRK